MIPVIPLPGFPGPGQPGPDRELGADLLASDVDRDVAADVLCAAVADGRITLAELDQRLEDVLSARTLRGIARVIAGLPGPREAAPVPPPPAETRWSLLQSLVARPLTARPLVA
jgi:DUF1707 SHOCT-like domain